MTISCLRTGVREPKLATGSRAKGNRASLVRRIEASLGEREEGAPRRRRDSLVPGKRCTSLKAWAGDLENSEVGSVHGRARKDGHAESFGGKLDEGTKLARLRRDPGDEAGVAASALEYRAQTAATHEGDHRLLTQMGERDAPAATERIAAADGEDQSLRGDYARADLRRRRLDTRADDRGVDVAVRHGIEKRFVVLLGEHDLDRWMGTMELPQRLGESVVDGPRDANPQATVEHAAQGGDRFATPLGRGQRGPGVRQQCLARRSEGDPAWTAIEKRLPELPLQAPDLGADRGLRDRDAVGRPGELPLFGDRNEVRELPQFHNETL